MKAFLFLEGDNAFGGIVSLSTKCCGECFTLINNSFSFSYPMKIF